MNWTHALPAIALLGALATAGPVSAQTATQKASFRKADLNQSGTVSWEEFRNYAIVSFHDLDANADGTVTPEEYAGIKEPVTIKEYNTELAAYFDLYDVDEDGSLSMVEWVKVPDPKHPAAPTAFGEDVK